MPTSEARINANRMNAARSTGPRTDAGKAISRQNSTKHGMSGAGVVMSAEEASEVEARTSAFLADFQPKSTVGRVLVEQMATFSVRMERGAKQEQEALASRVRHAAESFDQDRIDRAEELFDTLDENPRTHLRKLKRMPEGVDRLVEAWKELRDILTRTARPLWDESHQTLVAHLLGKRPDQVIDTPVDRLGRAIRGESVEFSEPGWLAMKPEARRDWAVARLVERIDQEILELLQHFETLNHEAVELDRLGAAEVALFDTSKAATLARRYVSEASRGFFKALKEFRTAEAEAADRPVSQSAPVMAPPPAPPPLPRPVVKPEPARSAEPLASFRAEASPAPRPAMPIPFDLPESISVPRDAAARGLDGRVISVGRVSLAAR